MLNWLKVMGFFPLFLIGLSDISWSYDISSELSFQSRYVHRGLLQSEDSPAIQGAIDVRWDNGAYVGGWGSWVLEGEESELEVDYYLGSLFKLNRTLVNGGIIYYKFPHSDNEINTKELYLIGYWDNYQGSIYKGLGEESTYLELTTFRQGPYEGTTIFSLGYQADEAVVGDAYLSYRLGWQRSWRNRWSVHLGYSMTSGLPENRGYFALGFRWYLQSEREFFPRGLMSNL